MRSACLVTGVLVGLAGCVDPSKLVTFGCDDGGTCGGASDAGAINGAACFGDRDCGSGHCVEGLCCESACGGACETCAASGAEGRCTARPATVACSDFLCDGTSHACPTVCSDSAQCAPGRACDTAVSGTCADVDECADAGACGLVATCTNTLGSFTCDCPAGYSGASTSGTPPACDDLNECADAGLCGPNTTCTNTPGSFDCACATGFFGSTVSGGPATCSATDRCAGNSCGATATCATSGSTFECTCAAGYTGATTTGSAPSCSDLDECLTQGVCGAGAACTNTPGSFTCACQSGYSGASTSGTAATCTDVNECASSALCGNHAHCTNSPPGTYTCDCDTGYFGAETTGGPTVCSTVDHCASASCGANAACANTTTSYTCSCVAGYSGATTTGAPATCADVNECATSGICGANATCTNTAGSYGCACDSGYVGSPTTGGPATCAPATTVLGSVSGTGSTLVVTLTQSVPVGANLVAVGISSNGSPPYITDAKGNAWTSVVGNGGCGSCGYTQLMRTHVRTALVAGDTVTGHFPGPGGGPTGGLWVVYAPAFPYLDQTGTSSTLTTNLPSATTSAAVTEPDELALGGFGIQQAAALAPDGGATAGLTFNTSAGSGIALFAQGTGLTGAQTLSATSTVAKRYSGAVATFYGGPQVAPTNLSLTQTPNSRGFTVSWTGGRGNDGPAGCQVQVQVKAGTWTGTTLVNCDVTTTSAAANLPVAANWYGGTWSSVPVRLVRLSDGAVVGTFATRLTCAAKPGSATSTPQSDENCNSTWDDHTCTAYAWAQGTLYSTTFTACTNSAGVAATSACTSAVESVSRYTNPPASAGSPATQWSSDVFGSACTGAYTGAVQWSCTGSGCTYY